MHARFIMRFVTLTALLATPLLLSALVVFRSGEMMSYAETVRAQAAQKALFGPAFNNDGFLYKLALYRSVMPEVAVIGSSRMLQFRKQYFSRPFAGCGMAVESLRELELFCEEMVRIHPPRIVLIGLDIWWFRYDAGSRTARQIKDNGGTWSLAKLTRIYQMLTANNASAMGLRTVAGVLAQGMPEGRIGLLSLKDHGFRPDGSYDYGPGRRGMSLSPEALEQSIAETLRNGGERWARSDKTYDANFVLLKSVVARLERAGVHVVLLFPPVLGELLKAMRDKPGDYGYVGQIPAKMRQHGIDCFDLSDAASLGSTPGEFIDPIHGGDATYVRLLLALAGKDRVLGDAVNVSLLEESLRNFAGAARIQMPAACLP